jgi:hypothetical protein
VLARVGQENLGLVAWTSWKGVQQRVLFFALAVHVFSCPRGQVRWSWSLLFRHELLLFLLRNSYSTAEGYVMRNGERKGKTRRERRRGERGENWKKRESEEMMNEGKADAYRVSLETLVQREQCMARHVEKVVEWAVAFEM